MKHTSPHDSHHEEHHHSGHHGHENMFKNRFFVSILFMVPILALSPMIQTFLGVNWRFTGDMYLLFVLSSLVYFYGGWPFLKGSVDEFRQKSLGMMTLIALAISVAYFYSTAVVFGVPGHEMYWELSTLIVIMLLGHWIEMKSIMGASNALEELVKFMPSTAHLLQEDGTTKEVPTADLLPGQQVLIKPGEKIPVDGTIIRGSSEVDESNLTGESVPVPKKVDDKIIGGSINSEGSLTAAVEKTGEESYLSQVIEMVKEAQESKSRAQNLANRAAKFLFYVAVLAGSTTFIVWFLFGYSVNFSIERMVTVMVIACPHALGLATPLVTAVSTSISARKGLLIRNRTNFEEGRAIDAVVFDKTGTLTKGEFGITDFFVYEQPEERVLEWAASIESQSEHPIARGIVKEAENRGISFSAPDTFKSLTGKGLTGLVENKEIKVISPGYMKEKELEYDTEKFSELSEQGKTVVFVLTDDKLSGMIALADQVRETSRQAVAELKKMGIQAMMLTGDNEKVARWVGRQLDLDDVYAGVLPHQKAEKIKEIQAKGLKVAMTGDGVNDAPALAGADLGIAVGAGTDVAIESADVILVRSDPKDVVSLLKLSRSTYRKMIQNLWWAAGYNIIALPLAAGVLFAFGILLTPAAGAVLMSLSTIVVAINARLLKAE
ncbi:copper-translocating P-type ATPase [Alkalicoccus saliphilus]|uniref:P-type Cu(+) transporter n=1 Tax=Alkalicoccus saliphilus TaxID=200989 RepID=A0A2T4U4C8_9BACI|nr:copper-translocating P-type ATPase [Alkalicoccus saliphilus]PTL38252.1 copper-translocating P-type ATPase [Alkalicoccus saliphilus]